MAKKTSLKRSLFIGLGGTGAAALLQTKKRFLDTYGEVPPMIGFLSIDTDFNTETKTIDRENILVDEHKETAPEVKFEPSELLYIRVQGAKHAYDKLKDSLFDWMPPKNEHVLRDMKNGASQVRSNGRFAIHFNYRQIIDSVSSKVGELLDINITDNSIFEPKGSDVEINFVFSVGGGTGSGIYIDIAYLVKEAIGTANNTTSVAFIVMPDIFNYMATGPSMENVRPNGFGALKDLDFLMRKDIDQLGLELKYQDKTIKIKSNPFEVVITVNNKNTVGETIGDLKDISEQIGLAMFTGASELSSNINSAYDNVRTVLSGGRLDIANKKAWAGGMGVSELSYDGNMLGNIYARRAISSMITNLITASNDSQRLANDFIDSQDVSIRENDGNDYLIDSLLTKQPRTFFTLDTADDINNMIANYLANIKVESEREITSNYNRKYSKVVAELKKYINSILNKDSGVANTKEFLIDLIRQLDIFIDEMIDEEKEFKDIHQNIEGQILNETNYLSGLSGFSSIFRKGDINATKQSISDNVNQQAVTINEILRRQYAQKFLNALRNEINSHKEKVDILLNRLERVKSSSLSIAANIQNNVNAKQRTFVIDLHKEDVNNVYVKKDDYIINDFIATIAYDNKLYDFHDIGEEIIEEHFWKYAKKLSKALEYRNKNIDDIIKELSKEEKEVLAKQLISKSNALWSYDLKGYKVGSSIHDDFVIGLPSEDSIFKNSFDNLLNAQNISFVHTGVKNKIVCYRMEIAVPVYAVNDIEGYEKDYLNSNISHHIDDNWVTKMDRENFSIWPEQKEDHSLEAWVLGFVYNFIKFEDGVYKVYSEDKGDALDDFLTSLSEYRDEAYDIFRKDDYVTEMIGFIEEKRKKDGDDVTKKLIVDVIDNYRSKYSQINLKPDELKKREFSKIADLLRREINFTRKELKSTK
jgi:hypothetical protein